MWSPVPIIEVQNIRPIHGDHEMENEDHLHSLVSLQFLVLSSSWALVFRVGCHALLQGIFPTQGWNPGLLHCRQILYQLSHQGSPCKPRDWAWLGWLISFFYQMIDMCLASAPSISIWRWCAHWMGIRRHRCVHARSSTLPHPHRQGTLTNRVNNVASLRKPLLPQFDLTF